MEIGNESSHSFHRQEVYTLLHFIFAAVRLLCIYAEILGEIRVCMFLQVAYFSHVVVVFFIFFYMPVMHERSAEPSFSS